MLRVIVVLALFALLAGACGAPDTSPSQDSPNAATANPAADPTARKAAAAVREGMAAMQEATAAPDPTQRDPAMEELCADVTQEQMDAVEEKVSDLTGETVVLWGDENRHLTCSRYYKGLRGE